MMHAPVNRPRKDPAITVKKETNAEQPVASGSFAIVNYAPFLHCISIPKSEKSYVTGEFMQVCERGLRETPSGRFLIQQLLQKEYFKSIGEVQEEKSFRDPVAFRFVG